MSHEVYQAIRDVVMWVVMVLVFFWGRDRKQTADALQVQFTNMEEATEAAFALRDQRLNAIDKRIDDAADRSSREGGRITEKMEELRERLVRVEAELGGRRAYDK